MSIKINDFSFSYGNEKNNSFALKNISLQISDRDFLGITGKSGCGKSTLIHCISGLLNINKNKIFINEKDLALKENNLYIRNNIGLVFQNPDYHFFQQTVEKEFLYSLNNMDISFEEKIELIKKTLSLFDFDYDLIKYKLPFGFSIGERRQLAIALTIICKPQIIIFDEASSGLDAVAKNNFYKLLKNLNNLGHTIIIVSHNVNDLMEVCDRIIYMEDGKVVLDNSPGKIYEDALIKKINFPLTDVKKILNELESCNINLDFNVVTINDFVNSIKRKIKTNE